MQGVLQEMRKLNGKATVEICRVYPKYLAEYYHLYTHVKKIPRLGRTTQNALG